MMFSFLIAQSLLIFFIANYCVGRSSLIASSDPKRPLTKLNFYGMIDASCKLINFAFSWNLYLLFL